MKTHHDDGGVQPSGSLIARVERDLGDLEHRPFQRLGMAWKIKNWVEHRYRELPATVAQTILGRVSGIVTVKSQTAGRVYRVDWSKLAPWQILKLQELLRQNFSLDRLPALFGGQALDYGVLGRLMVTDVGVGFIVTSFLNTTELETMNYHAFGTGAGAEAVGNTALTTEITTNHYTGSVRPTGTQSAPTAPVYKTIGTHTQATAGDTVTEHGVFSSATPAAGVLLDKTLFTGVALGVGDSFQATYSLTLSSGG
jgi:hypothetical protein